MDARRSVNTKFWLDEWIETLDPIERLLYLYLLTNPQTNIAGIYEISIKRMAFETGLEKDVVKKILERFQVAGKVLFSGSYIFVVNWLKNQSMNPKMKIGALEIFKSVPPEVLDKIKDTEAYRNVLNTIKGFDSLSKPFESFDKKERGKRKEERGNIEKGKNIYVPNEKTVSGPNDSPKDIKIDFDFENGKWLNIQASDTAAWTEAYPAVDIRLELNKMREWLKANPLKRKKNYRRFITHWLSSEQDRGGRIGSNRVSSGSSQVTPML